LIGPDGAVLENGLTVVVNFYDAVSPITDCCNSDMKNAIV